MSSRYPAQVDSSVTLPTVTNNFTPISADAVNRIRDAVINIESELGIRPSGTSGTVRARLDIITTAIGGIDTSSGGLDTQVQFNNAGLTDGDAGFTFNMATNVATLSGGLATGGTPATSGAIRLSNIQFIAGRDAGDTTDYPLVTISAADRLILGDATLPIVEMVGTILYGTVGAVRKFHLEGSNANDHLTLGALPATAGNIRLSGSTIVNTRSFDDSANTTVLSKDTTTGSDYLFIGYNGTGGGFATPMNSVSLGAITNIFQTIGTTIKMTVTSTLTSSANDIAIGATPATAGALRLANDVFIMARDFGDSANISLLKVNTSDEVLVGASTAVLNVLGTTISCQAGAGGIYGTVGISERFRFEVSSNDQVSFGAIPATSGIIRLPNTSSITFRDIGDSNNFTALSTGGTDLVLGSIGLTLGVAPVTTLQTGNSDGLITDVVKSVGTVDATPTSLYSWTITDNAVTTVDMIVTAITDDGSLGGVWKRSYTVRQVGGVVTAIGTAHDVQSDEDSAGWDATITNVTDVGNVEVTGDAVNITWYGAIRLQTVLM